MKMRVEFSLFIVLIIFLRFNNVHADDSDGPNSMGGKIEEIAKNIATKWRKEGLKITPERIKHWINILDKNQNENPIRAKELAESMREETKNHEDGNTRNKEDINEFEDMHTVNQYSEETMRFLAEVKDEL